jgi:CrcB protein
VGTLAVNVTGSLLICLIAGFTLTDGRLLLGPTWRQFLMAGICGGYTTFSSFSLQTLNLVRDGDWRRAGANALLSVLCCLAAVWLGHALAMAFQRTKGL